MNKGILVLLGCSATVMLSACGSLGNNRVEHLSEPNRGITTTLRTEPTSTTVSIEPVKVLEIEETKCRSISFDNGYILYIDKNGKYTIMNKEKKAANSLTLVDDKNNKVTVSINDKGKVSCSVSSFSYKGNLIEFKNGDVYFAGSKLEYYDTSFCEFELTDEITIECVDNNKFVIKKSGRIMNKPVDINDDKGAHYTIESVDKGVEITTDNNELMLSLVIKGNYLYVANGNVVINGKTMVPPGHNDLNTATTTTTTTTAATTAKAKETKAPQTEIHTETYVIPQTEEVYSEEPVEEIIYEEPNEPVVTESPMANNKNVNISSETSEMLGYVNELRKQYGLSEVYGLELLDKAASVRAKEISSLFFEYNDLPHFRADGSNYDTVIEEVGLPEWMSINENLTYGLNCNDNTHSAFTAWLNSPKHKENMLSSSVKYMGLACYKLEKGEDVYYFWDQIFYNDTF